MANLGYIQLVRTCNQCCRFCSNPETDYVLSPAQARARIDDLVTRGYEGVILTGGEPTLYPELVQIIEYAHERGIAARMITNGQKIAQRDFLAPLVAAGLSHVHLSVHTHKPELQAFLTGSEESLPNLVKAFDLLAEMEVNTDVNITIQAFNCGHLHELVGWLVERWPHLRHFVFNNLDPSSSRVAEHRDTIPRLVDIEIPLHRALTLLHRSGRTFRVERLPLCYMVEFAWASTESRKIVKGEERVVHFLDEKGTVRQTTWKHGKAECCRVCRLDSICAGLFEMGAAYSPDELYPVFVDPEPIIARIRSQE